MKTSRGEKVELPQRLDYNQSLEEASQYSNNNKELLELNKEAGCYYCCNIFPTTDVKEWCDNGNTALCPKCGIDSVLPNSENVLTIDILNDMYLYWFDVSAYSIRMKNGVVTDIVDDDGLYNPTEFATYRELQLEVYEKMA